MFTYNMVPNITYIKCSVFPHHDFCKSYRRQWIVTAISCFISCATMTSYIISKALMYNPRSSVNPDTVETLTAELHMLLSINDHCSTKTQQVSLHELIKALNVTFNAAALWVQNAFIVRSPCRNTKFTLLTHDTYCVACCELHFKSSVQTCRSILPTIWKNAAWWPPLFDHLQLVLSHSSAILHIFPR